MFTQVSEYGFRDAFLSSDTYKHNFSYEGLTLLYDWFEDFEESTGTKFEFDMVAICCDFAESTWREVAQDYNIDLSDCEDDDERFETVQDYVIDAGAWVGTVEDRIIYKAF